MMTSTITLESVLAEELSSFSGECQDSKNETLALAEHLAHRLRSHGCQINGPGRYTVLHRCIDMDAIADMEAVLRDEDSPFYDEPFHNDDGDLSSLTELFKDEADIQFFADKMLDYFDGEGSAEIEMISEAAFRHALDCMPN